MPAEYAHAVGVLPLPQRVARAVGESPVSERVADAQEFVYRPVLDWARRSPLHTAALGHSVHPSLTDLTLGCWTSASILDLAGGAQARRAATLVGAGLAAAVPTAIAGAGDWAETSGVERRIGAVHALGTDIATFLPLGLAGRAAAWRVRRRHPARPRGQRGRSSCSISRWTYGAQPWNSAPDPANGLSLSCKPNRRSRCVDHLRLVAWVDAADGSSAV